MKKTAFLAVAVLISFGCGTSSTPPETANTANSAPANTAVNRETVTNIESPESEKAKTEIINSTKKLQELKFWTAKTESETLPELNGEIEYVAPDRFRLKGAEDEAIVIGSDSYVNENGQWEKSEADLSKEINQQRQAMSQEAIKNIKNVQVTGKESINGKQATVYFYKNNDPNLGEITTKTWIADDSGLVLKTEVEFTLDGERHKQRTIYNYDKPVKIEAPKIN